MSAAKLILEKIDKFVLIYVWPTFGVLREVFGGKSNMIFVTYHAFSCDSNDFYRCFLICLNRHICLVL